MLGNHGEVDLDSQQFLPAGELMLGHVPADTDDIIDVAELYRDHFDYVWRILARFGVSIADLEDAAHEVFIVAHRRREEFDYRASPKSWLFGIARRVAARDLRTRARRNRRHDAYRQVCSIVPAANEADTNDARILLERFLATLDPVSHEIFVLAEFEQMTRPEISDALDMKVNTVSSRLRRSRLAFKAMLEESGGAADLAGSVTAEGERSPPGGHQAKRRLAGALMPVFAGKGLGKQAGASLTTTTATAVGVSSGGGLSTQLMAFAATVVLGTAGLWGVKAIATDSDASAKPVVTAPTGPVVDEPKTAVDSKHAPTDEQAAAAPSAAPVEPAPAVAGRAPAAMPAAAAKPTPAAAPEPAAEARTGVEAEMQLLREAKLALSEGRPAEALSKSKDHGHRHVGGALEQEMAAVQVQALCALGRRADAQQRGHAFAQRYPGSPLAKTLDQTCAG